MLRKTIIFTSLLSALFYPLGGVLADSKRGRSSHVDFIVQEIIQRSLENNIRPAVALAVAEYESRFNRNARNKRSSARGIFQILYGTARGMGFRGHPDGLKDAMTNIRLGIKYLSVCRDRLDDDDQFMVCCFHGGESVSRRACFARPSLRKYIKQINNRKRKWEFVLTANASL